MVVCPRSLECLREAQTGKGRIDNTPLQKPSLSYFVHVYSFLFFVSYSCISYFALHNLFHLLFVCDIVYLWFFHAFAQGDMNASLRLAFLCRFTGGFVKSIWWAPTWWVEDGKPRDHGSGGRLWNYIINYSGVVGYVYVQVMNEWTWRIA